MDSPRIPIRTGFYIQIKNGKAINPSGMDDEEAIEDVESWMTSNHNHPHSPKAEEWLQLKRQEVQETKETHGMRVRRADLDARMDKTFRQSGENDKLTKITREMIRDAHGITKDE